MVVVVVGWTVPEVGSTLLSHETLLLFKWRCAHSYTKKTKTVSLTMITGWGGEEEDAKETPETNRLLSLFLIAYPCFERGGAALAHSPFFFSLNEVSSVA